jgi:Xaa-Pro aminopeptidase
MMNYSARLERLRNLLQSLNCEALLIEHPINLLYLIGLELSTGKLLVSMQHACLIVDGRYEEKSRKQTLYPVQLLKENVLKDWITNFHIHQLGFDQSSTTYQTFLTLHQMSEKLKGQSYELNICPLESPVQQLRLIKDDEEIAFLRKAAHLGYQGYEFVVSLLREGISEGELALELEFFWKKKGEAA